MAADPGDQLLTMLEHDWVSDTSMTHLSFLLRHALFVHHSAAEAAMDAIRAAETIIESDFRGNADLMGLCTGSAFEGVFPPPHALDETSDAGRSAIPTDADLRCLHVFRKWTVDDEPVNRNEGSTPEVAGAGDGLGLKRSSEEGQLSLAHLVSTERPGCVRIKLRTVSKELSKFAVRRGDDHFLSRRLLADKVREIVGDVGGTDNVTASMAAMTVDDKEPSSGRGRAAWPDTESAPAGSGDFREAQTFGFACPCWPEVAADWPSRRRRHEWPEPADVSAAMSQGCHLVATRLPTSGSGPTQEKIDDDDDDITWGMCFAAAERSLVCSLLTAQRKCYALLLTLYHRHLSAGRLLSEQHVKHVMLWTCEQSTSAIWREDNLAECLLLVLDRLLHFVCGGNLPNFFLPAQNLLGAVSAAQTARLAGLIGDVRRNPVSALNACYERVKLANGASYEEVFRPLLAYLETYPEEEHPLECIVQVAFTVGHVFLSRDQRERALVLFEEGSELMLQICRPDPRSLSVLQLTAWLYLYTGHIDKAIEYYEIICTVHRVEDMAEGFDFPTCLANLACLYYVKSSHVPDDTIQSHLVEKARGCFEVAISEGKSLQVALHYAIFLLKLGQTEKAVKMLVDAAARDDDDDDEDDEKVWSHVTSFLEPEAEILDDDLGGEVREAGELEVPTVVLTQYLISKGLAKMGLRKQVKESNKALARLCRSARNDKGALWWSLLGYCFRSAGDLHSALKAFGAAVKADPYCTLAEDNYAACRGKLGPDASDTGSDSEFS